MIIQSTSAQSWYTFVWGQLSEERRPMVVMVSPSAPPPTGSVKQVRTSSDNSNYGSANEFRAVNGMNTTHCTDWMWNGADACNTIVINIQNSTIINTKFVLGIYFLLNWVLFHVRMTNYKLFKNPHFPMQPHFWILVLQQDITLHGNSWKIWSSVFFVTI